MLKGKNIKICLVILDIMFFYFIYYFSGLIVNNFDYSWMTNYIFLPIILFPLFKIVFNIALNNYNYLWQYGIKYQFLKLILVVFVIDIIILLLYPFYGISSIFNIVFLALLLELPYYFASRVGLVVFITLYSRAKNINKDGIKTLIVGAGSAGNIINIEFGSNSHLNYKIVAYIDDDSDKVNKYINGKRIYGPISRINEIISEKAIENVIIAMPSAGQSRIKEIANLINFKNISVSIVPPMSVLLDEGIAGSIRKVQISDLLGRNIISLDDTGIKEFINKKTVMVTGGAGSIGSELCRQIVNCNPSRLVIFDINENGVYDLQTSFDIYFSKNEDINRPFIEGVIGSVRDEERISQIIEKYKPDIIFHAAAHKHVPLMDANPREAILNNVFGTYYLAKKSLEHGVKKVVLISTDKAVNPTNVMGATKRFAEMIFEAFQKESNTTIFSAVRFGNVLGSNGSVIPLFEKQIKAGGPVTVTSEEINRFFMTIEEACSLVLQSGAFSKGGEKFILDMGEPVKIIDLAKNMIKLSGLELEKDISIKVIGLRPGEKMYEELLLDKNKASKTKNEKIFIENMDTNYTVSDMKIIADELLTKISSNKQILNFLVKKEKTH